MKFPSGTPSAVRTAVGLYVRRRKALLCWNAFFWWLGTAGAIVLAFVLIDRFWECSQEFREIGPWSVAATAALVGLAIVCVALWRWRPFPVAVGLDQALPENLDRWATSLDLCTRLERGESVGAQMCVERLLADTDTETLPASALRQARWRSLAWSVTYVVIVMGALLTVQASNFFDLPLLWRRFWHPAHDLPRDSTIVAMLRAANGRPVEATARALPPIPEGETFTLEVALYRKAPGFSLWGQPQLVPLTPHVEGQRVQPRLELRDARGARVAELIRRGTAWRYAMRNLASRLELRVRAADGLTQWVRQEVISRIKIVSVKHNVRHPGYTRRPDVKGEPLPEDRLSLLEGSRVFVELECDSRYETVDATFEVLADRTAAESDGKRRLQAWLSRDYDGVDVKGTGQVKKVEKPQSRTLRVRRRRDNVAQFRLEVEQTGLLRMQAVGANGLPSLERVCVIEATKDSPPRITLTGIDPDTYIIPGEVVAYDYRAEDDLAVADIIFSWGSAGSAKSEVLAGEEYINSEQLGEKTVAGRELIQRMNYYVYGTAPFEFKLIVIDSKGQESVTEKFRIHIVNNDFVSRFQDGMEYLDRLGKRCRNYGNGVRGLDNQLAIITKAVGDRTTWPAEQEELLSDCLERASRIQIVGNPRERASYRFGGFPRRLRQSLALLLAAERLTLSPTKFVEMVRPIRGTTALPAVLKEARRVASEQIAVVELWERAIWAEKRRFLPERIYHEAHRVQYGLTDLETVRSQKDLYAKNFEFYTGKLDTIVKQAESLGKSMPELTALLPPMADARKSDDAAEILRAAEPFVTLLSRHRLPPSAELRALAERLAAIRNAPEPAKEALRAAVAEVLAAQGGHMVPLPLMQLALADAWARDALSGASDLLSERADPVEVWFATDQLGRDLRAYHADVRAGRFRLDPGKRRDLDAELRERAHVIRDLLDRCPELQAHRDPAVKQLETIMAGDVLAASPQLAARVATAARGRLPVVEKQLAERLRTLTAAMDKLAERYDAFGAAASEVYANPPPEEEQYTPEWRLLYVRARTLQVQGEAVEAVYRMALLVHLRSHLLSEQGPGDWPRWSGFHGLQLAMTIFALDVYQRMPFRMVASATRGRQLNWEAVRIAGQNGREAAEQLRRYAKLIRTLVSGHVLEHDFGPLARKTRTVGHLEGLQREFETLLPALKRATSREDLDGLAEKLRTSAMGRIALAEAVYAALGRECRALSEIEVDKRPDLLASSQRIQGLVKLRDSEHSIDSLDRLLVELKRARTPKAALKARLAQLQSDLDEELALLRSMQALPVINVQQRDNIRFRWRNEFWPIATKIAHYDRRWLTRVREGELALARELVDRVFPALKANAPASGVPLQYAILVEMRARQIAAERRRNRGISFLEQEAGPSLRLPKHIADEFFRARKRRSPVYFKELTEAYFDSLYRDLR